MYSSLKDFYRNFMFPKSPHARQWTMAEIDQLDVHFFDQLHEAEEQKDEVYLSDLW